MFFQTAQQLTGRLVVYFRWVRAEHYRYVYTKFGSKWAGNGAWWRRKHVGSYLQPISLGSVRDYATAMRWTIASVDQEPK